MTRALRATVVALALVPGVLSFTVAAGSLAVDCLPDRVVRYDPTLAEGQQPFGAAFVPGILLGPPGESVVYQGAVSVASLGRGGSVVLAFDDIVIEDGPGPDLIVFENAFMQLPLPESADDPFTVFVEPAFVEVSADGTDWVAFPHDAAALTAASGVPNVSGELALQLAGLAGVTATLTGNWTVPEDPFAFDAAGVGGVSGAGGDAFDLADVGLAEARYVRITDADSGNGFAGAAEGFDLDAVVALHARPRWPGGADRDRDGLTDLAEQGLYGTDPGAADTDGDGTDDGREIAACRDPGGVDPAAVSPEEPRLWLDRGACTEARFTYLGPSRNYALVRGDLAAIAGIGDAIDLGTTTCLASDHTTPAWGCDAEAPLPGEAFFYLVRASAAVDWGRSSSFNVREAGEVCGSAP